MNRLVLIDGHAVLFRAFHAYPPLTTSKGELVNAVYGFTSILLNVINELKPAYIAVTFDRDKPTFRHTEYVAYKAQREPMPTELKDQQERVEEVVKILNIPIFAVEGYEADDVIGTLAKQAVQKTQNGSENSENSEGQKNQNRARLGRKIRESETQKLRLSDTPIIRFSDNLSFPSIPNELQVVIVTGDKDALQLVRDPSASSGQVSVVVHMPGRGKIPTKVYDEKLVEQEYGLTPQQIPDYKGLSGDASDNIAGVKGIGPKTAIQLLQAFSTVEGIYKHLGEVGNPRVMRLLAEGQESAVISKKMATIVVDVPIELDLPKCAVADYDKEKVVKLFTELEFRSLLKKLPNDSFEQMVQEALF